MKKDYFAAFGAIPCAFILCYLSRFLFVYIPQPSTMGHFFLYILIGAATAVAAVVLFSIRKEALIAVETALFGIGLALMAAARRLPGTAKLLQFFTGHYNTEATGFTLLFAALIVCGLMLGFGLGLLFRRK